jgi:hypothetical protein
MSWISILETPVLALPTLLLAGSFAVWAAWNVRDPPVRIVRAIPRPVADRDPISRAFHAYETGQFTELLARAMERLDRVCEGRFGIPFERLPATSWGARRALAARAPEGVALRKLGHELEALKDVAARREAGVWLRWDFWRSRAELRARFRARLGPLLAEVARITAPPTGGSA